MASPLEKAVDEIRETIATGAAWSDQGAHFPADHLITAILAIDGMKKDDSDEDSSDGFTTNGWDWDWWQAFEREGQFYTLSGSGYYGGHRFEIAE